MDAERLDSHKKILGVIYIVSSVFTLLIALFIRTVMTLAFGLALEEVEAEDARVVEFVMAIMSFLPAFIIVFAVVPTFIAGIALITKQSWGPLLAMIVGIFKLFAFPIGTAIGIYAIWIYTEDNRYQRSIATK